MYVDSVVLVLDVEKKQGAASEQPLARYIDSYHRRSGIALCFCYRLMLVNREAFTKDSLLNRISDTLTL